MRVGSALGPLTLMPPQLASACALNVQFHILQLDGVYVADGQPLTFLPLPTPTGTEVADIARRTAERVEKLLRAHGRNLDPERGDAKPPKLQLEHPVLAACYDVVARDIAVTGDRHESLHAAGILACAERDEGARAQAWGARRAQAEPSTPASPRREAGGATQAARLIARIGMLPEPVPRQPHPPLEQLRLPFD